MWGCGGLWRDHGRETLGSRPPTKTDAVGGQTPSVAWAGTAHRVSAVLTLMRGTTVFANWHCPSNRRMTPTSLMRGYRRSLWQIYSDTVCANGRDGRVLGARKASGGILPVRGLEE